MTLLPIIVLEVVYTVVMIGQETPLEGGKGCLFVGMCKTHAVAPNSLRSDCCSSLLAGYGGGCARQA